MTLQEENDQISRTYPQGILESPFLDKELFVGETETEWEARLATIESASPFLPFEPKAFEVDGFSTIDNQEELEYYGFEDEAFVDELNDELEYADERENGKLYQADMGLETAEYFELEAPPLQKNLAKSDPPGKTLYVQIALGKDKRCVRRNEKKECLEYETFTIRPMTGIYIPENHIPQAEVDLILYLHGHKTSIPGSDALIAKYWDGQKYPVFALREEVHASGKNVILVAPTLGLKSEAGDLVRRNGLDTYLDKVLDALKTYGPYQGQSPTLGNLILAAHSGAGIYMRMLAVSSNRYAYKIKECWGFDSLYNKSDVEPWLKWAEDNPNAKLYSYFYTKLPTYNSRLLEGKASNVCLIKSKIKDHFKLVKYYLRERLKDVPFLRNTGRGAQELSELSLSELKDESYISADELSLEESEDSYQFEEPEDEFGSDLEEEEDEDELDEWEAEENETYFGPSVSFPSGLSLLVVTGLPEGEDEEYWDPSNSGNPLLDTGPAYKDKKVSANFTVRELTTSGGKSADVARIDPKLVECIQKLRDQTGRAVTITSGYRSWKRNKDIYAQRNKKPTLSQHCGGRAADIKIQGMNGLQIGKAAVDACGANIGIGLANTFAHIDVRGSAAAWDYGGVDDSWVAEIKRYQRAKGSAQTSPKLDSSKPPAELVRFAQRVLNATEGERLNDDGDLGRYTRGALERFRAKYNLGSGGMLDDKTQIALVQRAIEEIRQQSLFGKFGMLDTATREALATFKSEYGLSTSITLDAEMRSALTNALAQRSASMSALPTSGPLPTGGSQSSIPDEIPSRLGTLVFRRDSQTVFKYKFTSDDLLWTARLISGEAGARDDLENRAVIAAMFNRFSLFTHDVYPTFSSFLRAYSTPLQPVLLNKNVAKHYINDPRFRRLGGTYKGTDIPRGQLQHHLDLQETPWRRLRPLARKIALEALSGQMPDTGVGIASEFASTWILYGRRVGPKNRTEAGWVDYTQRFKRDKGWQWIGQKSNLDQKRNAFFVDPRAAKLPSNSVQVVLST